MPPTPLPPWPHEAAQGAWPRWAPHPHTNTMPEAAISLPSSFNGQCGTVSGQTGGQTQHGQGGHSWGPLPREGQAEAPQPCPARHITSHGMGTAALFPELAPANVWPGSALPPCRSWDRGDGGSRQRGAASIWGHGEGRGAGDKAGGCPSPPGTSSIQRVPGEEGLGPAAPRPAPWTRARGHAWGPSEQSPGRGHRRPAALARDSLSPPHRARARTQTEVE